MKTIIFNFVSGINATTSTVSSLGNHVSNLNQEIANKRRTELLNAVAENTLASNILNSDKDIFSDSQLWVITFEVLNNKEYCIKIVGEANEIKNKEAQRKSQNRKTKSTARKSTQSKIQSTIDNNSNATTGARVNHPQFGEGTVISNDGNLIEIDFDGEVKKLMAKYIKLEVL